MINDQFDVSQMLNWYRLGEHESDNTHMQSIQFETKKNYCVNKANKRKLKDLWDYLRVS